MTNDATPTFTGMAEAGSTVKLYEGQNLLGETNANGQGDWSFTVPGGQGPVGGTYSISATAEDAAGNVSDRLGGAQRGRGSGGTDGRQARRQHLKLPTWTSVPTSR